MLSSKVNFPNICSFFFKFKKIFFFQIKIISINKDKANALPWVHYFRWLWFPWTLVFLSIIWIFAYVLVGSFPGGSDGIEFACNAGDPGLIPGSGKASGERNCNPLQYSCLENFLCDKRILWTEEPGELQSMGSQRIGHDWVTNSFTFGGKLL